MILISTQCTIFCRKIKKNADVCIREFPVEFHEITTAIATKIIRLNNLVNYAEYVPRLIIEISTMNTN